MARNQARNVMADARRTVVSALEDAGDVVGAVVQGVSTTLARSLEDTRGAQQEMSGLVFDTVTGAVHGVAEVGVEVNEAAKSIMMGAVRGSQQVGEATLQTVLGSADAVVRAVHDLGGDVGLAARGAVEGAIEAARDLGLEVEQMASAAATGAIRAAGEIGTEATHQVEHVFGAAIDGVKVVWDESMGVPVKKPRPKTSAAARRTGARY
jgi:hypothetical protein